MGLLGSQLVNAFVFGSILLLAALGLTLIFGLGRVVNFAHGALFSLGGLLAVSLTQLGIPFVPTLLLVILVSVLVGVVIDRGLIAWIRERDVKDSLLLTFGLSLLLTGIMYEIWGQRPHSMAVPSWLDGAVDLGLGAPFPVYRLFMAAVALGLTGVLALLLYRTAWGLRVRATTDDMAMASAVGLNPERLRNSVFGLGAGLVGAAGALSAPVVFAYATVGDVFLVQSFIIIVIGGLGSLRGAVVAAYLVGAVTQVGEGYIGGQGALLALFVVVVLFISVRPTGVFAEGREH